MNNDSKEIVFEGIKIPKAYKMYIIKDILGNNDIKVKKICTALDRWYIDIKYIKDLEGKTKKDIMSVKGIGENFYNVFIQGLKNFFPE